MNEQKARKSPWTALLLVGMVIGGAVALFVMRKPGVEDGGDDDSQAEVQLAKVRNALALTENMDPDAAVPVWSELREAFPEDQSVGLNRALNAALLVDTLSDKATNPLLKDAEKSAARGRLPDVIGQARTAIEEYEKVSGDQIKSLWLKTRVDLQEAILLQAAAASMTKAQRRDVFNRLTESLAGEIGKSPESEILGGPLTDVLDQMKDPIDGLPDDLLKQATDSVSAISNQHPDNIFLSLRAAQLQVESQSKQAIEFVKRTAKLASAIQPLLSEITKPIGLTVDQLVDELVDNIQQENWDEAGTRILQWFNVLNPTEIHRTDRRRASPHPLDRLSFQTLRRLSAQVIDDQPVNASDATIAFESTEIEGAVGGVVLPVDFNLDLVSDLAVVTDDGQLQLWSGSADGKWQQAGSTKLGFQPQAMCVADLFMVDSSHPNRVKVELDADAENDPDYSTSSRHDTFPGLVAWGEFGLRLIALDGRESTASEDRISVIEKPTGLEVVGQVNQVVTGDLEGDGDLDLIVATEENGVRLFINRGNRTFFEARDHQGGFDSADPVIEMAIADLDRDLDLDVVVLRRSGQIGVLENLLHLQFRGRVIDEIPAVSGADSVFVADVDGNISWDVVIGGGEETVVVFSQTADAGVWTVERRETAATKMPAANLADLDNDSFQELVSVAASGATVLRLGPWGIAAPISVQSLSSDGSLAGADFDGDGKQDFAAIAGGKVSLALNRTENAGHYIDVRFKGIADNAADSGRVNHFAIGSILELRFGPHYRSQIITSPSTHFGIGAYDTAGTVRVIFPNGLTQTIREPAVDAIVEEEQSLKGSCPYLYAWDGEKFVFMTDCLWAAPLGLQVARGVIAKDRPWEYLKVDGDGVRPRNGRYEFRITEELWEVAYLDKIAVTAIDRPADVQVWTNEKVGPADIAQPTVFAFRDSQLQPLRSAVDTEGRDVTSELSARDRVFVQGFDRRIRQGLCPPHWIDVDFGELEILDDDSEAKPSVYLVLTGWILPTDTSLNIQIDQNPDLDPVEFPSVWVPDSEEAGGWRKAIPFMGFPGGKTKTIVVDVTDALDVGDPRLRIRTSAQIYWDDAQLAVQTQRPPVIEHTTELLSAELVYHGFSARSQQSSRHPETYDYQVTSVTPRWPPLRGSLTQFGDCLRLIRQWDDRMVVMGAGDEVRMTFSVPEAAIPDGWQRDFVLHCVGWDKDADLNTLSGQTTGPLPHRDMGQYPPNVANRTESEAVLEKNRGHLRRHQSFRAFWHRGENFAGQRFLPPPASGF